MYIYKKRNLAYCGVDMHKDIHVAVIIDCWTNVLGEITFENRPKKFDRFIEDAGKIAGNLDVIYGLEDTRGYGRHLAIYLTSHKYTVKHINPAYTKAIRLSAPTVFKDDSYDGYCVARVLRDMIDKLPDAVHEDIFWTIRQLVKRRDLISKSMTASMNQLHYQLSCSFPSYRKFFCEIDRKVALYFWENYPSPMHLKGITIEQLAAGLKEESNNAISLKKAQQIFELVDCDGDTERDFQTERDFIVKGIVKEIRFKQQEISEIDGELERLIPSTGYKLDTMPGINLNTASHIISEIGDIERFPSSDKLARFCGTAPVLFSSAGKGKEQRSRQGNRRLNAILYFLAIQQVHIHSITKKARNPVFRDYFLKKVAEGKSKPQALTSITRKLVRVLYGMMKNKSEYQMPELLDSPAEFEEDLLNCFDEEEVN
jgi:transposase